VEARYRGITGWQAVLIAGMAVWAGLILNAHFHFFSLESYPSQKAVLELIAGLMILQGACEAFVTGVERMGARLGWDGFISGTIASLLSTIPEFVVIAFLVQIDPLAAFVTAVVTIFNNALIFSVYSFFLPKDRTGLFAMPRSVTMAGGELLIAGCAISLITGIVMLVLRINDTAAVLEGWDLIVVGAVLLVIYFYYLLTLVKYYGEGKNKDENDESHPPDPDSLGHDTSWFGIISMMFLGVMGAYAGGESIGGFAQTAIGSLGLPTIPTAAALAFFAGVSEYIIVYKSHRRGELGIALSNVFGGLSQVMFMLVPCGMILIGGLGLYTGKLHFGIPINEATILLIFLLFPLFYTLHQFIEQEKALSDLDAAAMTGIYLLLLYFLFTASR
jgi:hypothetical protein